MAETETHPEEDEAIDTINISALTFAPRKEDVAEKVALLERVGLKGVRRLINVFCVADPAWIQQLLHLAAPHVEELQMEGARAEHIAALLRMPHLRHLTLFGDLTALEQRPPVIPRAIPHCLQRLLVLEVCDLPLHSTLALLHANRDSLAVLVLWVGCCREPPSWPATGCVELSTKLKHCGLRALRLLLLRRAPGYEHSTCDDQRVAMRAKLGVEVCCSLCDESVVEIKVEMAASLGRRNNSSLQKLRP